MDAGQNIGGYELVERIAQGGMGTIWKARHPHLDRWVAIKQIRAEVSDDQSVRDAFLREVRHLSRLHSPHIVQVNDCGITDAGLPYMVTEFLEGEDLRQKLERETSVSVREALLIGIDVLKALAEAHGIGLVHRDLKPGNIFLQELAGEAEAAVKVLDFGVAKLMSADGVETQLQPSMGAKGSPRYMAPEQILSQAITPAVDIYSFGATLYRMVTGVHMFQGGPLDVLRRHVDTTPRPVRELAPDAEIPDELEDLIAGCLKKSPEDRPMSAAALRSRLEVILSRMTATAHDIDASIPPEPAAPSLPGDSSLPDWFQSTASPSFSSELLPSEAQDDSQSGIDIRDPDDSLDGSVLDWSAGAVIGVSENGVVQPSQDLIDGGDTVAELLASEIPDFDPIETREEAQSSQFFEDLRSQPIDPPEAESVEVVDPVREGPATTEQFSKKQLFLGGALGAVVILGLGLGVGLSPSAPEPMTEPIRRDASVSEWIKKVGTEIRKREDKEDRTVPTVVRRWAKPGDGAEGRVTIEIEQGVAKFVVAKTGAVLCEAVVECQVPITDDVRVVKRGFRTERLTRNELSDRRETRWLITLRR